MFGVRLSDINDKIDWYDLSVFVSNAGPDTALYRQINKETYMYDSGVATPYILADLFDNISYLRWEYCASQTPRNKAKPKKPKKYPRPWVEDSEEKVRKIGKDPIPVSEFDAWWEGGEVGKN